MLEALESAIQQIKLSASAHMYFRISSFILILHWLKRFGLLMHQLQIQLSLRRKYHSARIQKPAISIIFYSIIIRLYIFLLLLFHLHSTKLDFVSCSSWVISEKYFWLNAMKHAAQHTVVPNMTHSISSIKFDLQSTLYSYCCQINSQHNN